MFTKILIANRGEIACRVMRTCARLGIRSVAVFSDADASARHVALADEAVAVGPASAAESYLNIDRIIRAARQTGADAVHPGYGFLAENAAFAEACLEAGLVFIGPAPAAIRAMGSKSAAKSIMERAGVAVVPGYHGDDQDAKRLRQEAKRIGFPVLIKAAAGGGGKGMRIVRAAKEFDAALESCRREAKAAFGDEQVLIEKYLECPRHVEIQVFRDSKGGCVHLFERDCSVQRRHQKVIEEAPAPGLDQAMRTRMGDAAVAAAASIDYLGAGTVEFIVDGAGEFYFMEMNTRLQVEHPVTELITGQDLVEWQIRIAAGEALPCRQDQLGINGHAIEVRLYAEDPERDFLPSTGHLAYLRFPEDSLHIRVDTGVRAGDSITVHYDPMIAKLIVWDRDRPGCIRRLAAALDQVLVVGVTTNADLLSSICDHDDFRSGPVDTGFIERNRAALVPDTAAAGAASFALAALYVLLHRAAPAAAASPWDRTDNWRMNLPARETITLQSDGRDCEVLVEHGNGGYSLGVGAETFAAHGTLEGDGVFVAHLNGRTARGTAVDHAGEFTLMFPGGGHVFTLLDPARSAAAAEAAPGTLTSPMPGRIVAVKTTPGTAVRRGDPLVIIEAMKMEHTVTAPVDGTVTALHFQAGDMVDDGVELLVIEP